MYQAINATRDTTRMISVASALIFGDTPMRTDENTTMGRVVAPPNRSRSGPTRGRLPALRCCHKRHQHEDAQSATKILVAGFRFVRIGVFLALATEGDRRFVAFPGHFGESFRVRLDTFNSARAQQPDRHECLLCHKAQPVYRRPGLAGRSRCTLK